MTRMIAAHVARLALSRAQEALAELQGRLSIVLEPTATGGWRLDVVLEPRAT